MRWVSFSWTTPAVVARQKGVTRRSYSQDYAERFKARQKLMAFDTQPRFGGKPVAVIQLPPDFMLLQPVSWHPDVWTDVTRMQTLNGAQAAKGREKHLCPLQFDIVDRAIVQFSQKGETVYDPFGGLMTVPYRALRLSRRGVGCELNPRYFADGAAYCAAAEREASMPTLFDLTDLEPAGEVPA